MRTLPSITLVISILTQAPCFADETSITSRFSTETLKKIEALRQNQSSYLQPMNEVTVILDTPAPRPTPFLPAPQDSQTKSSKPVLVSGNRPQNPQPSPGKVGLQIQIEDIHNGTGEIPLDSIQLKTKFAAKPLSTPPTNWQLELHEQTPSITQEVEINPGTTISLSIQPHVLVPVTDGSTSFSLPEIGYLPAQKYAQTTTISSILGSSIAQLDEDSKQLGNAIDGLQRLLASLPVPTATPEPTNPTEQ